MASSIAPELIRIHNGIDRLIPLPFRESLEIKAERNSFSLSAVLRAEGIGPFELSAIGTSAEELLMNLEHQIPVELLKLLR